jgi:hypothetical protein
LTSRKIDWTPNTALPVGKGATYQQFDATVGPDRLQIETSAWGDGDLSINDAEVAHVHEMRTQLQAFQDLEQASEVVENEPVKAKRDEADRVAGSRQPCPDLSERRTVAPPTKPLAKSAYPSLLSVPAFWPMAMAMAMLQGGEELELFGSKELELAEEEMKIHCELRPGLATPNRVRLDLRTM